MNLADKIALSYIELIRLVRLFIINTFSRLLFRKTSSIKKILINRDGAFGDSIVALPALNIIRENYPEAQIDLLSINDSNISFKDLGLKDNLINTFFIITKQQRAQTLKDLKLAGYDLFIQIPQNIGIYKSIRNMLLVRFYLKINHAFGWDSGRIKSFMRLQKKYLSIPTETKRFISSLQKHDLHGQLRYSLVGQEPENPSLKDLINTHPIIVFLIGGKLRPKKWPLDHWVSLANLIGSNYTILIAGGEKEIKEADYIVSKSKNTTNVCGKLSVTELYYVLTKTVIAISLDTGAMHLCDAAGTRVIALISTRDLSNKWWPNNEGSVVIEKVLPCSFCLKTVCSDNICMKKITPEEVYAAFSTVD
jgi:ADP-heptose:LPS heptosyltransferase